MFPGKGKGADKKSPTTRIPNKLVAGGKGGKGTGGKGKGVKRIGRQGEDGTTRPAPYTTVRVQPVSSLSSSAQLATAHAIASSATHPKRDEVKELLNVHSKGWVDDSKFGEVLRGILF